MFQGFSQALITEIKNQMGISVYFQRGVEESQILQVRDQLQHNFPQAIKSIRYVSSAQALEEFKERHGNEALYQKALEEAGENAICPSLDLTVYQESQYEEVAKYLEKNFSSLIYQIDYLDRQGTIDKAFALTRQLNYSGLIVGAVLLVLVILVVFNTVRLVAYVRKEEIATMKLVGAPNWFVWGPLVVQGIIYGLIALVVTNLIFLPLLSWLDPHLTLILPNFHLWRFYQAHWLYITLLQLGTSVGLGAVSTYLATRWYLKV